MSTHHIDAVFNHSMFCYWLDKHFGHLRPNLTDAKVCRFDASIFERRNCFSPGDEYFSSNSKKYYLFDGHGNALDPKHGVFVRFLSWVFCKTKTLRERIEAMPGSSGDFCYYIVLIEDGHKMTVFSKPDGKFISHFFRELDEAERMSAENAAKEVAKAL